MILRWKRAIKSFSESGKSELNENVELFGMIWNKCTDQLMTKKKKLNSDANTKRLILKSIAENFDPYNFDGPILNRSKLFLHDLQMQDNLDWDDTLIDDQVNQWKNIARQVNNSESVAVDRFVGRRDGSYKLFAFVDSSKVMYGTVIYILDEETNKLSFLLSKNRIINKSSENRSIPTLELQAIAFGCETLVELREELAGPLCLNPVENIRVNSLFRQHGCVKLGPIIFCMSQENE